MSRQEDKRRLWPRVTPDGRRMRRGFIYRRRTKVTEYGQKVMEYEQGMLRDRERDVRDLVGCCDTCVED